MLTDRLIRLGRWARPILSTAPWASGLGLTRTLLALGTIGTLLTTPPRLLLEPRSSGTFGATCDSYLEFGLWCVVPAGQGQWARWISIAVLAAVASGWRPRLTGIAHWYVAWSFMSNVSVVDGGDQVTAVLAFLLIPITLTDPRRWHWSSPPTRPDGLSRIIAYAGLFLIQLQVAGIYLHASIAKLGVREWADGTALYYWMNHPTFGATGLIGPIVDLITASPVGVAVMTWSSIALEFSLAIAIVLRPAQRRRLLIAGIAFHGLIALAMGLVSFSTAMTAALLLYLLPVGHQIAVPGWVPAAWQAARGWPILTRLQPMWRRAAPGNAALRAARATPHFGPRPGNPA